MRKTIAILAAIIAYLAVFAVAAGLLAGFSAITGVVGVGLALIGVGWGTVIGAVAILIGYAAYDAVFRA